MAVDNRPVVSNLDFDDVKADLINHFKGKSDFQDFEFTGSTLNLLMDILSYNTHYYSLAANFLMNESFLDTAVLRSNVISKAKSLNYKPRSVRSAQVRITLEFTKQNVETVVVVPTGTLFLAKSGNDAVTFYTNKDFVTQFENTDPPGTKKSVTVTAYQGIFRTEKFIQRAANADFQSFEISDANADDSTFTVSVNSAIYKLIEPENEEIFNLTGQSAVYFLEESRNGKPQIVFGNGIAGKKLSQGDEILVTYLSSGGELGNGIKDFSVSMPTRPDVVLKSVLEPSSGGAPIESIQSVKTNAPKWFQSQYRSVTANDYEVMIRKKYADIQSIRVYGGEDVGYPGKVFVVIKPKNADKLSQSTKEILKSEIIANTNVVTVRPDFIDPQIFKLVLSTVVVYDKSKLSSTKEVVQARVFNMFDSMNKNYIGDFLANFRESNLSYEIREIDPSIISSNTRVYIETEITAKDQVLDRYEYNFNNRLYHPVDGFLGDQGGILSSSPFKRVGKSFESGFDEDGFGNVRLFDFIDGKKVYLNRNAGRINYDTGKVEMLYNFDPVDTTFTFRVIPESVDVIATQDMILEIDSDKSTVELVEIKDTALLKQINLSRSF